MNYGHRKWGQVQCDIRRSEGPATWEPHEDVSVLDLLCTKTSTWLPGPQTQMWFLGLGDSIDN